MSRRSNAHAVGAFALPIALCLALLGCSSQASGLTPTPVPATPDPHQVFKLAGAATIPYYVGGNCFTLRKRTAQLDDPFTQHLVKTGKTLYCRGTYLTQVYSEYLSPEDLFFVEHAYLLPEKDAAR